MEGGESSVAIKHHFLESEEGDSSRESGIIESRTSEDNGTPEEVRLETREQLGEGSGEGEGTLSSCGGNESFESVASGCAPGESESKEHLPFLVEQGQSQQKEGRTGVKKQGVETFVSQHRRRKETLQWQKQRRDEILDKIRQLEDSAYSDSETEDEMDFVQVVKESSQTQSFGWKPPLVEISEEVEPMEAATSKSIPADRSKRRNRTRNQRRRRHRQAPCKIMLSEWMLGKPDDFEDMWLGVVCPAGKRCIVMASRGKTKIFSRSDEYLGSYKSLLPGGCRYNYRDSTTNRNRGITILDCIWSQQTETFYVLDMICWNSHSCVNCDTEYRQFFLHSKFLENEELLERSSYNPFPFKPLPFFAADEMPRIMSSPIGFPEKVDGILFFHKEAFYIPETNPLCLWIVLSQVESLLNICVAPELLTRQVPVKNLDSRRKQIDRLKNGGKEMETRS